MGTSENGEKLRPRKEWMGIFDAVISISSEEHNGLGRYGDRWDRKLTSHVKAQAAVATWQRPASRPALPRRPNRTGLHSLERSSRVRPDTLACPNTKLDRSGKFRLLRVEA